MRFALLLAAACGATAAHMPTIRSATASIPSSARRRASAPHLQLVEPAAAPAIAPAVAAALMGRVLFIGSTLPLATAALSTRGSSGFPQIARSIAHKKPPPTRLHLGDVLIYLSRITYHVRMGYPLIMWHELVLLLSQHVMCRALVHRFSGLPRGRAVRNLARDGACLAAAAIGMARLPAAALPLLCLWTVPLALFSYGQQAARTASRGIGLGGSSFAAILLLRWLSCSARVSTTCLFLGADPAVLANHVVGLVYTQCCMFEHAPHACMHMCTLSCAWHVHGMHTRRWAARCCSGRWSGTAAPTRPRGSPRARRSTLSSHPHPTLTLTLTRTRTPNPHPHP